MVSIVCLLGTCLVEAIYPLWTSNPKVEQMRVVFRIALCRLVPIFMPDILFRLGMDGKPVFKEFETAIKATEFSPGNIFGSGSMDPIDYCVGLAEGNITPPRNLDIATIHQQQLATTFRFHISQYFIR